MNRWMFMLMALLLAGMGSKGYAQESSAGEQKEKEPRHSISIILSHAHIAEGRDEAGNKKNLLLPSWGIDYNYRLTEKWKIGLHTDLILEEFEVLKNTGSEEEEEYISRSYPVAPALMGVFTPGKRWSFMLGAGVEFTKNENYFLNRAGIEYSVELPKNWELFGSLSYDIKWNAYDNWLLGIGIAKKF